jgi:hypothetical protein
LTTVTQARQALRTRLESGSIVDAASNPVPLRWQFERETGLPDEPSAFVYTEFLVESAEFMEHGRGRGYNRFRNFARAVSWVFVPQDTGLTEAELIGNQIADLLRSYKDTAITCEQAEVFPGGDGASLVPPGLSSEVGNYAWATCETQLFFDLIG